MKTEIKKEDKGTWAIGGGVILGLGLGFLFFQSPAMYFVGCLLGGLGIGLIITAILSKFKQKEV
jgi:hypothetical protein